MGRAVGGGPSGGETTCALPPAPPGHTAHTPLRLSLPPTHCPLLCPLHTHANCLPALPLYSEHLHLLPHVSQGEMHNEDDGLLRAEAYQFLYLLFRKCGGKKLFDLVNAAIASWNWSGLVVPPLHHSVMEGAKGGVPSPGAAPPHSRACASNPHLAGPHPMRHPPHPTPPYPIFACRCTSSLHCIADSSLFACSPAPLGTDC